MCECVHINGNIALEKWLAQIRVSTASCCDLCTEESFEEAAGVKPFAEGEFARR